MPKKKVAAPKKAYTRKVWVVVTRNDFSLCSCHTDKRMAELFKESTFYTMVVRATLTYEL